MALRSSGFNFGNERLSHRGRDVEKTTPRASSPVDGSVRLAEFNQAPESIQAAFWNRISRQAEADREAKRYAAELEGPDPTPPALPRVDLEAGRVVWDADWSRRARRAALVEGGVAGDLSGEIEAVRAVPITAAYERLTGETPAPTMRCPLPGHDDRTPSFRLFAHGGWRCFGCGESGGDIYDLMAAVWQMATRGRGFVELHRRLREELAA